MTNPSKHLLNDLQVAATNQLLEQLVLSEGRMLKRMELLSEIVFELDIDGNVVFLNLAWITLTGYSIDEMTGKSLSIKIEIDDRDAFFIFLKTSDATTRERKSVVRLVHATGFLLPMEITVLTTDTGYVGTLHEIPKLNNTQNPLEYHTHTDALSKMSNVNFLGTRISQAIEVCNEHKNILAIVYFDFHGLNEINAHQGQDTSDVILVSLAKRFKSALCETDSMVRVGGYEFIAILGGLKTLDECHLVVEQLLQIATEGVLVNDILLTVNSNLGVTLYPEDPVGAEQLISHAVQASHVAMQCGMNRYHVFEISRNFDLAANWQTISRVEVALSRSEFLLFYQPKMNVKTGKIIGAEALIRWDHPVSGLLLPNDFLPIIENQIVSLQVGEWVISTALAQLADWTRQGLDLFLSVNISAFQLEHKDFVSKVKELLSICPLAKSGSLVFEILETSALENIHRIAQVIRECQSMGIKFALDDFGTGYSTLTYLKKLPADILKIDRSFIRDMLTNREDLAIVQCIMTLARAFGREVVAEGVETFSQIDMLKRLDCDNVQGFVISRPMHPSKFPLWIQNWNPALART